MIIKILIHYFFHIPNNRDYLRSHALGEEHTILFFDDPLGTSFLDQKEDKAKVLMNLVERDPFLSLVFVPLNLIILYLKDFSLKERKDPNPYLKVSLRILIEGGLFRWRLLVNLYLCSYLKILKDGDPPPGRVKCK